MERTLEFLSSQFPIQGRLETIILRPTKRGACELTTETTAIEGIGLAGDHSKGGKRQVSLIQHEHLPVIAALSGHAVVDPLVLRRNLVVSGINLLALKPLLADQVVQVRIGEAVFEIHADCDPCSRMESLRGPGGFGPTNR